MVQFVVSIYQRRKFSNKKKLNDIYICDNANSTKNSYSNVGVSYEHPQPHQGLSYLAGSYQFQLSDIEVYEKF